MKIDSHQHFWKFVPEEYEWISPAQKVLRRHFLPADLSLELAAAGLAGCVAVEARQSLVETQFLLDLARENSFVRGVVGWVPLADPNIGEILELLARDKNLKGARHVVQGESDPNFLEHRDFNQGIRALTALGLTYDLLILARQLPATLGFVDRHPEQKFVLDHIAKPEISGLPPPDWERNLRALAERKNVLCKFSGVVTEVNGAWTPALLRPYFDVVLEAFGADRVMFGSDWPVCLLRAGYREWSDFVTSCTAPLATTEREKIWGGNAAAFYSLS